MQRAKGITHLPRHRLNALPEHPFAPERTSPFQACCLNVQLYLQLPRHLSRAFLQTNRRVHAERSAAFVHHCPGTISLPEAALLTAPSSRTRALASILSSHPGASPAGMVFVCGLISLLCASAAKNKQAASKGRRGSTSGAGKITLRKLEPSTVGTGCPS